MAESMTKIWKKNQKTIGICVILLCSLLMMRFIIVLSKYLFSAYPPFRILMALDLIFVLIIPLSVIFIWAGSQKSSSSFLVPFVIIGLLFPFIDVIFLDFILLTYPDYFIPQIIGGMGYGFIGLAGNKFQTELIKSMIFFSIGMGVILVNSAAFIPLTYFVLTGDPQILQVVPGL